VDHNLGAYLTGSLAERGESVVVNLRPDADVETEFVGFDRPRVVRALKRFAADLDKPQPGIE
jgi:hypothetical protein